MRILMDDHLYKHEMLDVADKVVKIQPFVLTRFNIPLSGAREKGGFEEESRFREWCINRSEIFKRICLPSLVGQSMKPTAWLLLFDAHYEEETRSALDAIAKYSWIVPIMVDTSNPFSSLRQLYTPEINKRLDSDVDYVITSRLDNDDAITKTYVDSVFKYAQSAIMNRAQPPFWISFPYGVQWDGEELTLMLMNNNPFLSLLEPSEKFIKMKAQTAMSVNHGKVFDAGEVKTPTSRFPMWLQYTHVENVSNRKNSALLAFRDASLVLKRNFGISADASLPGR